jgi:ABC-type protease/lipase transport system fused ATPase/permease subunit
LWSCFLCCVFVCLLFVFVCCVHCFVCASLLTWLIACMLLVLHDKFKLNKHKETTAETNAYWQQQQTNQTAERKQTTITQTQKTANHVNTHWHTVTNHRVTSKQI